MDHVFFTAQQTAATYVANGLDEVMLEKFELHLMGCRACVEDVESWRAIHQNVSGARVAPDGDKHADPRASLRSRVPRFHAA